MSEVEKLESRIEAVKNSISIMDNQLTKLERKIKAEYLVEESDLLERLYEMKDKAVKEKTKSEHQLNALEEQMVIAIKADAQAEMVVNEKKLQALLDKHNNFNEKVMAKVYETLSLAKENSVSEIELRMLFVKAKELEENGAVMRKGYSFEILSPDVNESLGLIKNRITQSNILRDVNTKVYRQAY